MVDEKKPEVSSEQDKLLNANVGLVLAENDLLKKAVADEKEMTADLTKKLKQALDLIEQDTKRMLIADIIPRTTMPKEYIGNMSVEKLQEMQGFLKASVAPVFKSGTPMGDTKKKPTLDGIYEEYAAKTWRKNQ